MVEASRFAAASVLSLAALPAHADGTLFADAAMTRIDKQEGSCEPDLHSSWLADTDPQK